MTIKILDAIEKDLTDEIQTTGAALVDSCPHGIFPYDALLLTALARSLNLIHGFHTLATTDNYTSAAGLLRFQLDNVLRAYGVLKSGNPHEVASSVLNGERLSRIKDKDGNRMSDAYLVQILSDRNPWIRERYEVLSGYVHLSQSHFQRLIAQSKENDDGTRDFTVSDTDDLMPEQEKTKLATAFVGTTRDLNRLISLWTENKLNFGTPEQLKQLYTVVV